MKVEQLAIEQLISRLFKRYKDDISINVGKWHKNGYTVTLYIRHKNNHYLVIYINYIKLKRELSGKMIDCYQIYTNDFNVLFPLSEQCETQEEAYNTINRFLNEYIEVLESK